MASKEDITNPLTTAIENYHDLNTNVVGEIHGEPSPLEFLRWVRSNRPFVARHGAGAWDALRKWDANYLRAVMGDQTVKVAVTPSGNADSVVEREDGTLLFMEPYEMSELFEHFLDYVRADSQFDSKSSERPVRYAQTQNDNLREEYSSLFDDVPHDIAFARIALEKQADAVNLWIGNERSVTALHKDNYENIYVQVCGQKHFVLLPPIEMPCVNEQPLPRARYEALGNGSPQRQADLVVKRSEDDVCVPVATWDPDVPKHRPSEYSHLSQPLRVTLNEGDMLYLPAMWYHKVSQSAGAEGFACAVNYWYDMDFDGSFWTGNELIRDLVEANRRNAQEHPFP